MKNYLGLLILITALVIITGCTQPTQTTTVTTVPTTAISTVEVTTVATTMPTPESTTIPVTTVITEVPLTTITVVQTPQTKITTIHIRNNTFVPTELMVLPGTQITWVNDDSHVHTIKATGNATGMFNSGEIITGAGWGYSFSEKEGRFEFTDPGYPQMTGVIIVQKGASVVGAPTMQTPTS